MYKLQKSVRNEFKSGKTEKEDHNVNLERRHWQFLDDLAEKTNSSRNQALREVLDQFMEVVEE